MTQPDLSEVFGLAGHHALVTGGGSGLGLGIARCFVRAGARVTLAGTNGAKLAAAASELGHDTAHHVLDVTRTEEAEEHASRVAAAFGPVSILVNNAGTTVKNPVPDMSPADFAGVMNVHVNGAYALSRAFLSQVAEGGEGSILFTASMSSFLGVPNIIGYSAAKSAYLGLIRAMATEFAPIPVRVNGVAPGWIDTPLFRAATAADPARRAKIDGRIPMTRLGREDDIGWAMTYLASRAAGYVTGHVLVVDGGALHAF